jgi:hypothetical protein
MPSQFGMPGSGQHRINALDVIQSRLRVVILDTKKTYWQGKIPCLVAGKGCIRSPCIAYYANIQAMLVQSRCRLVNWYRYGVSVFTATRSIRG